MTTGTLRQSWSAGVRRLERIQVPFAPLMTAVAAAALLVAGAAAILNLRSFKYLAALIVLGAAGAIFLAIPRKYAFLLFSVGFTMPFFVETILVQRDRAILSVTGTLLVVTALAVVGLATGIIERGKILLEPRISIPALLFVCVGLLSLVNTTDRTLTLLACFQELEMVFIFLVLINSVQQEKHFVVFLRGLYLGFAIECCVYVVQNILGFSFDVLGNTRYVGATDVEAGYIGSQRGTFATAPATAALYFSVLTLSLTGLYLSRRNLRVRLKPLLGMMMGGSCLVLAAKRAPMVGFMLAILVMCFLLPRYAPGALRRLVPVLASLAVPVLALLPVFLLRAGANHQAALEERLNLTRVAWNMYDAHPVLGVGFGTYDSVKREYLPPDWSGWLYTVHNRYLLVLAETGTVGLMALLLLYGMILWAAWQGLGRVSRDFRPFQLALMAGLIAIFWEQLWDIFNGHQQGYIFWLVAVLVVSLPRALPESSPAEPTG